MPLPPGQRLAEGFPRFGTHLHRPAPPVPAAPAIVVAGAVTEARMLPVDGFEALPRREIEADFHCVAGWSATGLRWGGVPFAAFYRELIEPRLTPGATVTHVVFSALDGYRCPVQIKDALADDVIIADSLDGRPLTRDRGAPVRLVSPSQYGFVSVKHLTGIDVHTANPGMEFAAASRTARALMLRPLFKRHPRARVWEEERNPVLPNWLLRPVYRTFTPPIRWLSARGGARADAVRSAAAASGVARDM